MAEFKLGRLKFVWKGEWSTTTLYVKDDIVKYGGSTFICVSNHAAAEFDDDLDAGKWQVMTEGIQWETDPWTPSNSYKNGSIVRFGGKVYISTENHTSSDSEDKFYEDLSNGLWNLLVDGQSWEGVWQISKFYKVGDIVKYGAATYICNEPHTSSDDINSGLEADLAKWDLKSEGVSWRNIWSPSTKYLVNDVVKYGANTWIANSNHISSNNFDDNVWTIFTTGTFFENEWNPATIYQFGDIVTYGGNSYIAIIDTVNETPSTNEASWALLTSGYDYKGLYLSINEYKVGSVVNYGANTFVALVDVPANQSPNSNPEKWATISTGFRWLGNWSTNVADGRYKKGDVVKYNQSSFVCIQEHIPVDEPTEVGDPASNRPDLDLDSNFWNVVVEGDEQNVLSRRGDILTRNAIQNIRLPKGPAGTYLKANDLDLEWSKAGLITRVFYVSTDGVDDPTRGTTLDDPWRTIKFACDYIRTQVETTPSRPAVVMVKTGVYQEIFPISIPKFTSLVGDELRMSIIEPTPATSHLDKFYMRDSTTVRNFTFRGATGAPGTTGLSSTNQFGTRRPTGGAWISLDPGEGPNDESVWVGERSPYMQNITLFGDYCTGQKIDGSLHNGGNKSIVSNDFTTILSNGIGAWCANQGRAELVSVFTYYSYIGYLCETGGVIRATNGNNSYGTFGSVSEGVDPTEISRTANVDNRRFDALIDSVFTDSEGILYLEYNNAGESYTTANYNFTGPGANDISLNTLTEDGAVTEVRVVADGTGYIGANNNAQLGTDLSIRLSASDTAVSGAYNGTRITIVDGAGVGQYGIIAAFDGGTKECFVLRESEPPVKVTATEFGTDHITVESSAALEEDMPVMFIGTNFGGLSNTELYYVKEIINSTTITVSDTLGGDAVELFTATGLTELYQAGWDSFIKPVTKSISNITKTNPVRVTTSTPHGLSSKFAVVIDDAGGVTQLENNLYYISKVSATQFDLFLTPSLLNPVNGLAFSNYTTGGQLTGAKPASPFLDTTSRYFIEPRPVFSTGEGAEATAVRTLGVDVVTVNTPGGNYTTVPTVLISGPDNSENYQPAVATTGIRGSLSEIVIQSRGTAFGSNPILTIVGGGLPSETVNWSLETVYSEDTIIRTSSRRLYRVVVSGITGESEPTHESGIETNGSIELEYLGRIATATAQTSRSIRTVTLTDGGSNYTTPPSVIINGQSGSGAIVSAQISQVISSAEVLTGGSNYTSSPQVSIIGGDPIEFATAVAVLSASVTSITMVEGGSGYDLTTTVTIVGGGGEGATATPVLDFGGFQPGITPGIITSIVVTNGGLNYNQPPTVVITGTGTSAQAISNITGSVQEIQITNPGRGYKTLPEIVISGGGGNGATAEAIRSGSVVSLTVVDGGLGWVGTPTLSIQGGGGSGATATVSAMHTVISSITVTDSGDGYTSNPAVSISGGREAILRPRISAGITTVTVQDPGSEYTATPIVSFVGGGNYSSPVAGLRYYRNASGIEAIGPRQGEQTLAAINRVRNLLKSVANNINPAQTYQTAISRIPAGESYIAPVGINNVLDIWVDAIYSTIENGTELENARRLLLLNREFIKIQTRRYIDSQFSGVATSDWNRDFGLIVDAVARDIGSRGVNNTVTCGISQAFLAARQDETGLAAAKESLSFMKDLLKDIVQNIIVTPFLVTPLIWRDIWAIGVSYQINDVVSANNATYKCLEQHSASTNFVVDLDLGRWEILSNGQRTQDIAFESESLVSIDNNLNLIDKLISNSPGSLLNQSAATVILTNVQYIKAETIAFVNETYQDFDYNQILCARDVGFIVEAVAKDIVAASVSLEPTTTTTTTGVVGRILVDQGGIGYSQGVTIELTGGGPTVLAVARPIINEITGSITGFNLLNKGKGYASAPSVVITPDTGFGAIARCRLAGTNVAKITIIDPGSGYSAGPFLRLIDPNVTDPARFSVRVSDGVLSQPEFLNRSSGWITAEATVTGDGFADITQTGTFVFVKNLTNLPTPGANVQFAGNSEFYKLVNIRDIEGPSGLLAARQLLLTNKPFIEEEIVSYLDNFIYDSVKCSRDVGLIIDALAQDFVYGSNAKILAALHSYRRGIYTNFEDQRFQTAFALEYLKSLILQDQKSATIDSINTLKLALLDLLTDATAITRTANNSDIILNILENGLTSVPEIFVTDPTGFPQTSIDARRLLLLNRQFIISEVISFIESEYPSLEYNEDSCARDVDYIIDALRYDLTYGGNLMSLLAGNSYYSYSSLVFDTQERTATLAAYQYLATVVSNVVQGSLIATPKQTTVVQNTSGDAGALSDANFLSARIQEIRTIIGNTGTPAVIEPSLSWVSQTLIDERAVLLSNKAAIQSSIIEFIEEEYPTLVFNRSTCSRDIGLIIDAIGWDLVLNSNFQSIKSGMAYYRATAGVVISGLGNSISVLDILIEWIKNEEFYKNVPLVVMPNGNGSTQTNNGKDLLLANADFIATMAATYYQNENSVTIDKLKVVFELKQLVYSLAHDLTYLGNVESTNYAKSFILGNDLIFPGFNDLASIVKPTFLDLLNYLEGIISLVVTTQEVTIEENYVDGFVQVTDLPSGGSESVTRIESLISNITEIIDDVDGDAVAVVQNTYTNYAANLVGNRQGLLSTKPNLLTAVTAWIEDNFVNFTYDRTLTRRDAGLIVQAVADDIFGDFAKTIEAGNRFLAPSAEFLRNNILPQTIAAIDRINIIAQKVIRNETYVRTQNNAFQERFPALSNGSDGSFVIDERIKIVRRILEYGTLLDSFRQVLLDNKVFLQSEVISYINASYEDLDYDQNLCSRDVGLIIDAIVFDIFGGLSRSREAGLRYYSTPSGLVAITSQLGPTVDAIRFLREGIKSVLINQDPSIKFQEVFIRNSSNITYDVNQVANLLIDEKVNQCIDELINVILNGPEALPPGNYSVRLQISPPLTVETAPLHLTDVTIRSKYSQVRLTGHDFLNIGTGDKSDTNYPGIPVNIPDQLKEIREVGGGRVFYTSTDQDGNFRVGELFRVEQSTGIATLNADAFNLSGLNELSLGGITLGGTNAVIREFSTDPTFFANSDNVVPTQKAIRTFIQSALGSGGGNIAVNAVIAGQAFLSGDELTTLGNIPFRFTSTGGYFVTSGVASVDPFTGSLVVDGGVGISGDLNVAGTATANMGVVNAQSFQGPIGIETPNSGSFTTVTASTQITVQGTTQSDSTTTGSLVVTGGVGIGGNVNIAGSLSTAGLSASSLNNTPIGSVTRSSGAFTTLAANAQVSFTANTASTTTGTGTVVVTGGVGISGAINIGSSLTANGNNAAISLSPTGTGTVNISPAGAVTIAPSSVGSINNVTIGATTATTGRFTTVQSTVATGTAPFIVASTTRVTNLNVATAGTADQLTTARTINGVSFNGSSDITISAQATNTSTQLLSLGVGTTASGTSGEIRATNNITAYFSDRRLKENITPISNALEKVLSISGVTFNSNDKAAEFGYTDKKRQVGVIAQEIEQVLPEIVVAAPFDIDIDSKGQEISKSGDNYKTVQYEKLVPLLIEAIKEQQVLIKELQKKLGL